MSEQFTSAQKLYQRVLPALHVKQKEFECLGYYCISDKDIWDSLVESKWKKAEGLMLFDIVSDIMNVSFEEVSKSL